MQRDGEKAIAASRLVFTLSADWGPSSLTGCTIAAYLQSALQSSEIECRKGSAKSWLLKDLFVLVFPAPQEHMAL